MAEIILRNVLNTNITIDELFDWLTSENIEATILPDIGKNGSTRAEFVSYFLNDLREQCKSILSDVKDFQEKPSKKLLQSGPQVEAEPLPVELLSRKLPDTPPCIDEPEPSCAKKLPASPYRDFKSRHGGKPIFRVQPKTLPHPQNTAQYFQDKMSPKSFPPLPNLQNPTSPSQNVLATLCPDPTKKFQVNTPQLMLNSHCPVSGRVPANIDSSYNVMSQIIPTDSLDNFSHAQIQMEKLSVSSSSEIYDTNFPSLNADTSSPQRFNNSSINASGFVNSSHVPLSPMSPLYATNTLNLCPRRKDPSYSETSKHHDLTSGSVNFSTCSSSTPKSGSGQKSDEAGHNQSSCLGDFVKEQAQQSKAKQGQNSKRKKAQQGPQEQQEQQGQGKQRQRAQQGQQGKEKQEKVQQGNRQERQKGQRGNGQAGQQGQQGKEKQEKVQQGNRQERQKGQRGNGQAGQQGQQGNEQERHQAEGEKGSSKNISKSSQMKALQFREQQEARPPTNEKKSTRRIKPTRLDVTDDNKNCGKEVSGVISRPTVVNPKFVEALSMDKSEKEVTFETERGLLKLERQRQPKNESTDVAGVDRKSSKKTKIESTAVPQLDSVKGVETLKILARIYSGIIDRNLMTNPMTELYFLVTLLTNQYRKKDGEKCSIINNNDNGKEKSSASAGLLEMLKNDLGCAKLIDEASTDIRDRESINGDREFNDRNDNSTCSNSGDSLETRGDEHKDSKEEYLGSAHNCVFFATMVMFEQQSLLSVLDRATLKLLCENQQIAEFQPKLQKYLSEMYSAKCSQTNRIKQSNPGNSQRNVCFQVDTDNRETFPSLVAFSLFRKQRDLFYDILKVWEEKHLVKGWIFSNALKTKINSLMTLHTDPVNYCHFAKLFVSQLLVSSIQSGQSEDPMNDESLSFLKSLKHLNPEKLMQLKERLVTPLSSIGPVPQPVFPGVQEFYEQFILLASNWKFYVILEMTLIREIVELNEVQFAGSEIEGTGTTVDESTKQNFITCVSSLRLLAKFLSFTVSLPLRSAANSPEWFGLQTQLRSRILPSLDLQGSLVDALTHRRLSLTVPWIVQYMAMLDTITLRMPYYANLGEILYGIYRISNRCHTIGSSDDSISPQTAILMMFTIGWLFDLPHYPRELHACWQINYDAKKLRSLGRTNSDEAKNNDLTADNVVSSKQFDRYNSNLDKLDIIDDRAIYECCPFLTEFKVLLISGNAVLGNSNANRHITPISSKLSQPTLGVKKKNLHMQLEEAFFHGQPNSIRKTVDFVAERVASSCVKYICNTIIPAAKERNMEAFIKSKNGQLDMTVKDDEEDEEEPAFSPKQSPTKSSKKSQAEAIEHQLEGLTKIIVNDVKNHAREKIPEMCETRTHKSIEALLADNTFPCVTETCIAITRRNAMERIDQWIDSHIIESLFLKTMTFEVRRLLKKDDIDQAEKENCHNPGAPCPAEVIGMMRSSMWELLERKGRWSTLSLDSVGKILTGLKRTLTERADLVDHPEKNLYKMSVEYCLLLLTHRQDLYGSKIQQQFIDIWKMSNARRDKSYNLFVRIISPRNIRLLASKSNPSVFKVFGRLLKGLLMEDLLSIEALSEQCVALFRQEWPTSILKQLSQCLNDVTSDYKSSDAHAEGVKYLLGWIASTCDEMEIWDYE